MFLTYHKTLHDGVIEGLYNFNGGELSPKFATLPSLVAVIMISRDKSILVVSICPVLFEKTKSFQFLIARCNIIH